MPQRMAAKIASVSTIRRFKTVELSIPTSRVLVRISRRLTFHHLQSKASPLLQHHSHARANSIARRICNSACPRHWVRSWLGQARWLRVSIAHLPDEGPASSDDPGRLARFSIARKDRESVNRVRKDHRRQCHRAVALAVRAIGEHSPA